MLLGVIELRGAKMKMRELLGGRERSGKKKEGRLGEPLCRRRKIRAVGLP